MMDSCPHVEILAQKGGGTLVKERKKARKKGGIVLMVVLLLIAVAGVEVVQVYAQISGLRDAGCTGGFMTWNATSSLDKYSWLMPSFAPPADE